MYFILDQSISPEVTSFDDKKGIPFSLSEYVGVLCVPSVIGIEHKSGSFCHIQVSGNSNGISSPDNFL